jgi:hypothetical protein
MMGIWLHALSIHKLKVFEGKFLPGETKVIGNLAKTSASLNQIPGARVAENIC